MYLSYGDKLRLVNSVLSSLSTFYLSTIKVYQLVLGEFDKYRRQCQWRKNDLEAKSSRLAAYEFVYRPKDQDELDVVNFSSQNNCLPMKHLHQFYNRANLPWIKSIWGYITIIPYHLQSLEMSCFGEDCLKCLGAFKEEMHI
jgi:hypothetical protein